MLPSAKPRTASEIVEAAKHARLQRRQQRDQSWACIVIQKWVRGFITRKRIRTEMRLKADTVITDSKQKHPLGLSLYLSLKGLLPIFEEQQDSQRLVDLCKLILRSFLENVDLKLWYGHALFLKSHTFSWLRQVKLLGKMCCTQLARLRVDNPVDRDRSDVLIDMLYVLTEPSGWTVLSVKQVAEMKTGLQKLCANILGELHAFGLLRSLRVFLLSSTCEGSLRISHKTMHSTALVMLRILESGSYSGDLLEQFIIEILTLPAITLHWFSACPQVFLHMEEMMVHHSILAHICCCGNFFDKRSLSAEQGLCILANISFWSCKEKIVNNMDELILRFVEIALRSLKEQLSVSADSACQVWHPVFGWSSIGSDQSSVSQAWCHVITQLKHAFGPTSLMSRMLVDSVCESSEVLEGKTSQLNRSSGSFFKVLSKLFGVNPKVDYLEPTMMSQVNHIAWLFLSATDIFQSVDCSILPSLSFHPKWVPSMWRALWVSSGLVANSIEDVVVCLSRDSWAGVHTLEPVLRLLLQCSTLLISLLSHREIHEKQQPFSYDDLALISSFLARLTFQFYLDIGPSSKGSLPLDISKGLKDLTQAAVVLLWLIISKEYYQPFLTGDVFKMSKSCIKMVTSDALGASAFSSSILRNIPFVIPFKDRLKIFHSLVGRQRQGPRCYYSEIRVRRSHLFEDGYQKLSKLTSEAFRSSIRVIFINKLGLPEAGVDLLGLTRELLEEMIKNAFDPSFGLFRLTSGSNPTLYPSPTSDLQPDHLGLINFCGKLIGKALVEGILVDVHFALFFIVGLTDHCRFSIPNCIDMLPFLDQDLYKHLLYIKEYEGAIEDLELTFSFDDESCGQRFTHELIPRGADVVVNSDNRIKYIHLLAYHMLYGRIQPQIRAFKRGLHFLLDPSLLDMFTAAELQRLISGSSTDYSVDELRASTKYEAGYHGAHPTILWLWDVLKKDFSREERAAFLKFVTSSSRPPLLGFASLVPPFTIYRVDACSDRVQGAETLTILLRRLLPTSASGDTACVPLPTSSTCFNRLLLPAYPKRAVLRERLRYAIRSGAGFELV